jgi:DNA-binding CsgD family transcriptional regulator
MHSYNGRMKAAVYLKPNEFDMLRKIAGHLSYSQVIRKLIIRECLNQKEEENESKQSSR